MTTLTPGAVGADATPTSAVGTKLPKLKLVKFRQNSSLSLDCYKNRLLKQRGVHAPILNGTRAAIKIANPGEFLDLEEMLQDCLLHDNAERCPGKSGTVRHVMIGDNVELSLETCYPDDLWKLVFNHRLSDLDPPAPAA